MKTKLITIVILSFLMSLLTGCASRIVCLKRVHSKGIYFAFTKHRPQPKNSASEAKNEVSPLEQHTTPQVLISDQDLALNTCESNQTIFAPSNTRQNLVLTTKTVVEDKENGGLFSTAMIQPLATKTIKGSAKGAVKFLHILLCLLPILCLIPVYLHDDKTVTMNFWLTLALHLTLLGYAVFALLVVLNVVDLR